MDAPAELLEEPLRDVVVLVLVVVVVLAVVVLVLVLELPDVLVVLEVE